MFDTHFVINYIFLAIKIMSKKRIRWTGYESGENIRWARQEPCVKIPLLVGLAILKESR